MRRTDFTWSVVRVTVAKKRLNQPWREFSIRDSLRSVLLAWKEQNEVMGAEYIIYLKNGGYGSPAGDTKLRQKFTANFSETGNR